MTSEQTLEGLPFRDIQTICKQLKLLATGKKADLIKRIMDAQLIPSDKSVPPLSSESESVSNDTLIIPSEQKFQQKVEVDQTKNLDEATRRRMRQERFGAFPNSMNMSSSAQSVSELQKLSLRAARFGISTSNREF
jgi:hypothetical protein